MSYFKGCVRLKSGFTLAEVLITLGIIGVVAAMTLPALVQNYKAKVLINQARKTYNVIANALVAYSNDIGTPYEYYLIFDGSKTSETVLKEFGNYLQIIESCNFNEINSSKCGGKYFVKRSGNTDSNSILGGELGYNTGRLVLKDGAFVSIINDNKSSGTCFFEWNWTNPASGQSVKLQSKRCGRIYFDVNGLKGPNIYGQDVFEVEIFSKKFYASDSLHSDLTDGLDNALIKDKL